MIDQSVRDDGYALVRGALAPELVARYRDALERLYATGGSDSADVSPDAYQAATGLALMDLFATPALTAAARRLLGPHEQVLSTFTTVAADRRRHSTPGIGLHTDGIIQGTAQGLTLTLWAPLHPCGVDAPGLAVIRAPQQAVLRYLRAKFPGKPLPGWCSTTHWNDTGAFAPEALAEAFGEPHRPALAPGDVMVFTNWTIHGSHVLPGMTQRRSAAILRLRGIPLGVRLRALASRLLS